MKCKALCFSCQAIVIILLVIANHSTNAQCTVDSSRTGIGVLPDTLPAACAGSYYEFSVTVRVPSDTTTFNSTVGDSVDAEICWNRLDSIQNVPNGLSVQCDPSLADSCKYPGGSTNCALVSGTPSIADTGWHEVFIFSTGQGCADDVVFGQQFNGCSDPNAPCEQNNVVDTIYIRIDAPVTAQVSNDTFVCQGESTQLLASGGQSYHWSPGNGLSDTSVANPVASPSDTTTYMVTVSNGACSAKDSVTVQVDPPADAQVSNDTSLCSGDSVQLTASGGQSYEWSPANGLSDSTVANPVASPANSTMYTVNVTDGRCSDTASVSVSVDTPVTAQVSNDTFLCPGTSTQLMASGGQAYEWSPSDGLNDTTIKNPVASPSTTTEYMVTVSNGACSDVDTVTVERSNLTVDAGNNANASVGNSVTLGGNPAISGGTTPYAKTWTPDSNLTSSSSENPTATFNTTGTFTYTFSVTDDSGCTATDNVTITVTGGQLTADAGPDDTLCLGSSTTIGGSPTAAGGDSPYDYNWSPNSSLSNDTVANPAADPTSTTTYTVTVTDNNGNTATDNMTLTVVDTPGVNIAPDSSICNGASIEVGASASGGTTPYDFSWTPASSLQNPNSDSTIAMPNSTTTYNVEVSDANGCLNSGSLTITVNQVPNADAGQDGVICKGDSITLNASGGSTYKWTPDTSLDNNMSSSPTAFPSTTTNYTVTVTSSAGCVDTDTVMVTVQDTPSVNTAPDASICSGSSTGIGVSPSGGVTPYSYKWTPAQSLNIDTIQNPTASPTSNTTYNVEVTDDNGCAGSGTLTITVNQTPDADAGSDKQVCKGDSVTLNASGGAQYQWTPAATLDDNMSGSPQAFPTSNATYTVTVTSSAGCQDTDSVKVAVQNNPSVSIEEPAADTTVADSFLVRTPAGFNSYSWSNGEETQNIWVTSTGTYSVTVTDNNGCTASDTTNITITGIEDRTSFAAGLSVHPNPNKGKFTITIRAESSIEGQLKLFNLHGQVLRQETVTLQRGKKQLQMDLEDQSSGLYYLQLKTEKGVLNRKIVVR